MRVRRILAIFAITLAVSSALKLAGVSLKPIVTAYEHLATSIMIWLVPEIFTEVYPAGVNMLALYIPAIFILMVILFIFEKIKYRNKKSSISTTG